MEASVAKASRMKPLVPARDMTDGQLADEHRGFSFSKKRASDRLKAIEDELERRNLTSAQGEQSFVSKQLADVGLVDIKRLRADLGEQICREYAIPGSDRFWRSSTLRREVNA